MIRPDKIKTAMFGGVGWRQSTVSGVPTVTGSNLTASSGLIFQDGTSFVTLQNIIDCQEDSEISDAEFNIYLANLQNAVILEACQKVVSDQSDFINTVNLFPYEKSFNNTITPSTNFVGFEIERTKDTNILGKINWIELAFDSVKTFNVYLYNSNLPKSPIKTQSVTTVAGESVIVALEDWELADDATFKGGKFYWGYFESDLDGAEALKKDYELSDLQVSTRCHYITPVTLEHSGSLIDITTVTEVNETYGLNFGIDTYNDYTELLIRNKSLFYQPIQYQMAEKIFNLIRVATRSNNIERLNKDFINDIGFEIYGNIELGIQGINGKLKRSIEDLRRTLFRKPLISRGTLS
jgi:hypothetical protein